MSRITQSGRYEGIDDRVFRNASPLEYDSVVKPTERNSRLIARHTDSSSSTTTTNGVAFPILNGPVSEISEHSPTLSTRLRDATGSRYWTLVVYAGARPDTRRTH